ncbi:Putative SUA5-like translation factor [Ignavibacterium album JCM 16511]|uniref:Threonylcarbamoyl-AMP synthase n=1 Tax=Ignavibacterium album (strain DSM 19864 / JCM 16511 / NBRC 101810 / Mat9-16) TaxID=945713 RepID=I0AFK2_IGNAJ|nr:L-threonylcarbamoyladenylate synthase [Ignavibacterium album]AFH47759.1 Putative SUA5-like translation factor [Ignavibacterium album JCM 16511]
MNLEKAAEYIRNGKLVAFPTETVYGLGANALDPFAVSKIFELKERPAFDPLIVHIESIESAEQLADTKNNKFHRLAEKFWPGPLTIVLPKKKIIPDIVTSGLDTVGLRMPNHKIALELIKLSGCPIAAPSANKFGRVSPTSAQHVKKYFPQIDCIIDGGKTQVGIESTVIYLYEDSFEILRPGIITSEEIETEVSLKPINKKRKISAPGMMKSHYSPAKPIYILNETLLRKIDFNKAGLLSFTKKYDKFFKKVITLSESMDLKECAVNLFSAIHLLEDSDVEIIIAEPVPETGIGIAIMDRLKKAAYKTMKSIN